MKKVAARPFWKCAPTDRPGAAFSSTLSRSRPGTTLDNYLRNSHDLSLHVSIRTEDSVSIIGYGRRTGGHKTMTHDVVG